MSDPLVTLAAARRRLQHTPADISSSSNPKWRHLRELLESARERRRSGQTVLEGWHLLDAWLATGRPIRQLVIPLRTLQQLAGVPADGAHAISGSGERTASPGPSGWPQTPGREEAARQPVRRHTPASAIRPESSPEQVAGDAHWLILEDRLFGELDLLPSPSPVLAVVDIPQPALPGYLGGTGMTLPGGLAGGIAPASDTSPGSDTSPASDTHPATTTASGTAVPVPPGDVIVLDRVQDPGNVGTILRTAAAAGIRTVLTTAGTAACWAPKVLRAGMGGHFVLEIHENIPLEQLKAQVGALPLAGTVLQDGQSLYATDLRRPLAWVFGNEGEGIDPELQAQLGCRLTIPQDPGVESLNVAASAAVCLFEQRRQRLASAS